MDLPGLAMRPAIGRPAKKKPQILRLRLRMTCEERVVGVGESVNPTQADGRLECGTPVCLVRGKPQVTREERGGTLRPAQGRLWAFQVGWKLGKGNCRFLGFARNDKPKRG
jgi:hypothetical protein